MSRTRGPRRLARAGATRFWIRSPAAQVGRTQHTVDRRGSPPPSSGRLSQDNALRARSTRIRSPYVGSCRASVRGTRSNGSRLGRSRCGPPSHQPARRARRPPVPRRPNKQADPGAVSGSSAAARPALSDSAAVVPEAAVGSNGQLRTVFVSLGHAVPVAADRLCTPSSGRSASACASWPAGRARSSPPLRPAGRRRVRYPLADCGGRVEGPRPKPPRLIASSGQPAAQPSTRRPRHQALGHR
jgi:hypothetical protein